MRTGSSGTIGGILAPENGDSSTFDPNQTAGGNQGTNSDSTDDLAALTSLVNLTMNQGYTQTISLDQGNTSLKITGVLTQANGYFGGANSLDLPATDQFHVATWNWSVSGTNFVGGSISIDTDGQGH